MTDTEPFHDHVATITAALARLRQVGSDPALKHGGPAQDGGYIAMAIAALEDAVDGFAAWLAHDDTATLDTLHETLQRRCEGLHP